MNAIRLAFLSAVLFAAPIGWAQTQTTGQAGGMGEPADAVSQSDNPERIDLKTDRISLSDLIDYLSEQTRRNIVLMAPPNMDANAIIIPPLKLKNVSLDQVLELVTNMPGVELSYDTSGEGESTIYILRLEQEQELAPVNITGRWHAARGGAFAPADGFGLTTAATGEPYLSVIPLERMLMGAYPADRVGDDAQRQQLIADRTKQALTLIDQAFQMTPDSETKPEIKLHAETNTLLVKATPRQLQTINQVLAALEVPGPSESRRDFERQLQDMTRAMEVKRTQMQDELQHRQRMMEERLVQLNREKDELTQQREGLRAELEQLKAQVAAREAQKPQ